MQWYTFPIKVIPGLLCRLLGTDPLKCSFLLAYFSMKNGQVGAFISSQSWVHCSSHLPSHIQLGTQLSLSCHQNSSSQHPPLHPYSLAFLQNVIAFAWRQALMPAVASHPAAFPSSVLPPISSQPPPVCINEEDRAYFSEGVREAGSKHVSK